MTQLSKLGEEITVCRACHLAEGRINVVPGEGSERADLLFIGEAPGAFEDKLGRPFVGAAGKFLDELLHLIHLERKDVYIANVIKCRPPSNRDPQPDEIATCKPWLDRQIEIINPSMIITLGRFSMALFMPGNTISKCHGSPVKSENRMYYPMYHPAAALHQQSLREVIKADMAKIPVLLAEIKAVQPKPAAASRDETRQMKLL